MRAFIREKDPPPKTFYAGFVGLMAQLPNLKTLAFSAAEASYMTPQKDLYCLAYFPRLESLVLDVSSHGEWEQGTTKSLSRLTALSSLQLHISDLRLGSSRRCWWRRPQSQQAECSEEPELEARRAATPSIAICGKQPPSGRQPPFKAQQAPSRGHDQLPACRACQALSAAATGHEPLRDG